MAVDYYKLLQVQRNARGDDLRKAAEAKLNLINDAYEVLSDPIKRAVYDQHGEEGLKREAATPPDSPGSTRLNFTDFFGAGTGGSRVKETRQPEEIFSTFFEGRPTREDVFQSFGFADLGPGNGPRKAAAIERTLPCTLEELYNGATKKLKIFRDVLGASGRKSTVEEVLTIEIKPGWKKGTKITFQDKGHDTQRGVIPADIVFIVDEKPHSVFKRDGDNLIVTQTVSLAEALAGHTAQLTALDGRNLRVSIDSIICQAHEEVVRGEGMPIQKEQSKKGNLIVKFSVKIPKLTSEQKSGIRMLLPSS
ncbi:dnaJ homolog subfamily B member 4 [Pyrus x bretschneideri]|uniref:dnaJ homolog subfamily B member 4 n=1 Tax=Pyrus x bretschneideri TaxID=225117 RepID=UPI0005118667|nr:dnaJ homolog subfamily B member 4 [Pyrus x bretschneideri]